MSYFKPEDLKKFGNIVDLQPEMGKKFFEWYGEVFKEGALTVREKNLIEEQMMEAVHVAAAIKGGATLVNAVPMMNTIKAKLM